jgi:hypothetical protein
LGIDWSEKEALIYVLFQFDQNQNELNRIKIRPENKYLVEEVYRGNIISCKINHTPFLYIFLKIIFLIEMIFNQISPSTQNSKFKIQIIQKKKNLHLKKGKRGKSYKKKNQKSFPHQSISKKKLSTTIIKTFFKSSHFFFFFSFFKSKQNLDCMWNR